MTRAATQWPASAKAGEMRCANDTRRTASDATGQWRQVCVLPLGHDGPHRLEWEEIEVFM